MTERRCGQPGDKDLPNSEWLETHRFSFPDLGQKAIIGETVNTAGGHDFINLLGQLVRLPAPTGNEVTFLLCRGTSAEVVAQQAPNGTMSAVAHCHECEMYWPSSHFLSKSASRRRAHNAGKRSPSIKKPKS